MTQTVQFIPAPATAIQDVSPTAANTTIKTPDQSVTGRMLSFASTSDGQTLFTGTYSNIWRSLDGGETWQQTTRPEPPDGQFGVPGALGGWCVLDMAVFDGWRITRHPRYLADLRGNGRADLVGFGEDGVWTALSNGDGTFEAAKFVLADFGYNQGWRVDKHPRMLADVTGNGRSDIVAFAGDGVHIAYSNGDGTFTYSGKPAIANFGYDDGWRVEKHPRILADVTGNGRADIVAFGDDGVHIACSNGDGTFDYSGEPVVIGFGHAHGWRVEKHPRVLADVTGNGRADIVAFGDDGVYVARNKGGGAFDYNPEPVIVNFGHRDGWHVDKHPRILADITGDGRADIVAFGDAGVYVAFNNGNGTFEPPKFVCGDFGYNQGWRVDKHLRELADITGDGRADIVAFGDAGVWTALNVSSGTFETACFVFPNFGWDPTILALTRYDRAYLDAGIYRSTDNGNTWMQVYKFRRNFTLLDEPPPPDVGQLLRAPGSSSLVYATCENTVAISNNGGASFYDAVIQGFTAYDYVYHVAASVPVANGTSPQALYILGRNLYYNGAVIFVSFDGGVQWMRDETTTLPANAGSGNNTFNGAGRRTIVTSPQSPLEVYTVLTNTMLWHGDYTNFSTTQQSVWSQVVSPPPPNPPEHRPYQDSGCVCLAVSAPGQGDVLFLNPKSSNAYIGPLNPQSPSDWLEMDPDNAVHPDLHDIFLSADFKATFENGEYQFQAGTVWLLCDGGIFKSTDGGVHFQYSAWGVSTLAAVNVAGVAIERQGVALSLGTGDNAGFYSMDGGASWSTQDYLGGDNSCSYADPLRPHSMLVYTPRSYTKLSVYEASLGDLPDGSLGTTQAHRIPGPADPISWNADSLFGERGSRPLVLSLPGDDASIPGDYVFVLSTTTANGVPRSAVVRTQNIFNVTANDWINLQQGPDLPDPNLVVLQTSGGHTDTVFYAGGNDVRPQQVIYRIPGLNVPLQHIQQLWTWRNGMSSWQRLVPGGGSTTARRFFVNPYNPSLIYILDADDVKRSDDGGQTWQQDASLQQHLTCGGRIPVDRSPQSNLNDNVIEIVLTDMQFDPYLPNVRLAIGLGGVFYTADAVNWHRLLDTAAIPGRPMNMYYDWISSAERALYVSFAGRGLLRLAPLPIQTGLVAVPDVVGSPPVTAENEILAAHLAPKFTGSGTYVGSQDPVAGTIVSKGSDVRMYLHSGQLP